MDWILLLEIILIVSFEWVCFKWPSMQVEDNANRLLGFSKGSPWHLNRGDHLIQVKITVTRRKQIYNFDNQSLNTGYWLNTVPLNTGATVHLFKQMTFILQNQYQLKNMIIIEPDFKFIYFTSLTALNHVTFRVEIKQ